MRRELSFLRPEWKITSFPNPDEALEVITTTQVDVIVSDMKMPEMSGLEFIEQTRNYTSVPAIILTGSPELEAAIYTINEVDVFKFFTKPCAATKLVDGIELAVEAYQAQRHFDLKTEVGLATLDHLALSVVVVDENGQVIFQNKSARALLSHRDGLSVRHHNMCHVEKKSEREALFELIRLSNSRPNNMSDDIQSIAITRPSMKRPYSVFVSPIFTNEASTNTERLSALYISDPDTQPVPELEQLMSLHKLTRAQANIVKYLATGLTVEEASHEAGVTVKTARTYLKQAFGKTDTTRQSELLKLVLAAPRIKTA
jgi:DNA-binding NarL/FixJ family response regulator